jgi:two-component system, chemotaxis family, protein-glutamate methylesterase/glutaminase
MEAFAPLLVAKVRSAAGARLKASLRLRERVQHRIGGAVAAHLAPRERENAIVRARGGGVVLVGASTGGPPALEALLTALPAAFPGPILIAQHMPASFTGPLARRLDGLCAVSVVEILRATRIEPGFAYIGRGDADLVVLKRAGDLIAAPAPAEPDYPWRPSVDRLVDSALEHIAPKQLIGILMTGMGNDGAGAMSRLRALGGWTIAEAEETAVVWGMPGELVKAGGASFELPLPKIAQQLKQLAPLHASRS